MILDGRWAAAAVTGLLVGEASATAERGNAHAVHRPRPDQAALRRTCEVWSYCYDIVASPWEAGVRRQALAALRIEAGDARIQQEPLLD